MTKNYASLSGLSVNSETHQTEKAKENQVANNAGGYVFAVDKFEKLRRFLILGSAANTYYVSAKTLTKEHATDIVNLFKDTNTGKAAVDEIVQISESGRAPKNDPAIFALALAASCDNEAVRSYSLKNLNKVCRIGTHLFTFVTYVDGLRGWGRSLRKAVANWYSEKEVSHLAYQVCKYPQRKVEGELPWSHRDLLRKVHLKADSNDLNVLLRYVTKGREGFSAAEFDSLKSNDSLKYVWAHEQSKAANKASEVVALVKEYGLTRESVTDAYRANADVWRALLPTMPANAMLRNIRNMTKAGVLTPFSDETEFVVNYLTDQEKIHKARLHPMNILGALAAYDSKKYNSCGYYYGFSSKTQSDYTPVPAIVDALDDAFYASFQNVEPTGKRILIGVDVSGSMSVGLQSMPNVSCSMGAAALAMTIARTEKKYDIRGFSTNFVDLKVRAKDSLSSAIKKTSGMTFGGTDCSLPVQWAMDNKQNVDAFVVLTDSETYAGSVHPYQLLKKYRKNFVSDAKMIVVGMVSNGFSIADPQDKLSLDVVGFDTATPVFISDFIRGDI